jgi:hypothetical protein
MEITTAQKVRSALANQTIGWAIRRKSTMSLLKRPTCSSNSQNQSRLELESPITTGKKTMVRVRRLSGVLSAVSRASAKPRTIRIGVRTTVYLIVNRSARQNPESFQILM